MSFKNILKKYKKPSKKGYTLVEMITVVALLVITSGATLSVFLMVHQVTDDASEITIDQYNTATTEKLIRNELQVASNIDILKPDDVEDSAIEDDEYIQFIPGSTASSGRIIFWRADSSGDFDDIFMISDVQEMNFSIVTVDETTADKQPYKFFYNIVTEHYTYSGGFILGNTLKGGDYDESMENYDSSNIDPKKVVWKTGSPQNDYVISFHRNVSIISD